MGYLKSQQWTDTYKRVLIVGGDADNAGLTASLKSVSTDDGAGSANAAPFLLSTGEVRLSTNKKLEFRDSGIFLNSSADGKLDIDADGEIELSAPTFDLDSTTAITIDCSNTTNGVTIATATSAVPITIGHSTSETTVSDNLTITGTTTATEKIVTASGQGIQFVNSSYTLIGDGSNVTLTSGGRIDLTATSDVRIPTDVGLQFVSGSHYLEYIAGTPELKMLTGSQLNLTGGASSTFKSSDGTVTVHADGSDDKAVLKGDNTAGVAVELLASAVGGDIKITAGTSTGQIDIDAGSSSDGLIDVDGYQLDIDTGAGGITIDGTGVIQIGANANAGNVSIGTNTTARTVTIGNKTGASALTLNAGTGKLDVQATGELEFTTTKNGASAIYLRANGGTSETVKIHSDQGTGTGSIELTSDAGGIDVNAGKGMTIDTADTTTFTMTANDGSAKYLTLDSVNSGSGAAGIKIGTTSATTVSIGHTTSETTVNDNLTVTGNLTVSGTQTYTDLAISDTTPTLISTNTTEENADGGRESVWSFKGEKADGTSTTIASIRVDHQGSSDDYKGEMFFKVNTNSSADGQSTALKITHDLKSTFSGNVDIDAALDVDGGTFIFNESSGDYDFRCESNNNSHMIFMDAGNDRVGIKESAPSVTLQVGGNFAMGTGGELTVSTGSVTATHSYHTVDTESDASTDDLDTISGGVVAGQIIVIKAENTARSVVAKDGTGNLKLAGDFTMDNTEDTLMLVYDGSNWLEVTRSNNGA